MKYYSLERILKKDAEYYMIYGEKSNGKTYAINSMILHKFLETGEQGVYVRRWTEDIMGATPASMYNSIYINEIQGKYPQYSGVSYYRRAWYLVDHEGKREKIPFMYAFSLGSVDHTNGSAYPNVRTIFFDEFTTRGAYQPDEYERWQILLSNIIRDRGDVKIFMAGNTVNKISPYFKAIDFKPDSIQQGEIVLLKRGVTRYALEYTDATEGGKKSDKYFYSGKTVSMITKGAWEMAEYPKAPAKWSKGDIMMRLFIIFNGEYISGEFVHLNGGDFIFFYPKKIKKIFHPESDIVFCDFSDYRWNYYDGITRATDDISRLVALQFQRGKIFYADNDTGEILRNFIIYSVQKDGIRRL